MDVLDRLFLIQHHENRVYLPRSADVAAGLNEDERRARMPAGSRTGKSTARLRSAVGIRRRCGTGLTPRQRPMSPFTGPGEFVAAEINLRDSSLVW